MPQPFSESPNQEALKLERNSAPADVVSSQEISPVALPVRKTGRQGFLPFQTNTWDRFFVSVLCFVAISLLWMRFVEPYLFPHNIWVAVILSIILGVFIVRRG
jgi:predicted small integral membrane protein